MSRWGLPKDEYTETGAGRNELYVREARRMVSDYVMTSTIAAASPRRRSRVSPPTPWIRIIAPRRSGWRALMKEMWRWRIHPLSHLNRSVFRRKANALICWCHGRCPHRISLSAPFAWSRSSWCSASPSRKPPISRSVPSARSNALITPRSGRSCWPLVRFSPGPLLPAF